jgi:tricorn protease
MIRKLITFLAVVAMATVASAQERLTRLLRQPDIHGDQIAFVYAGDLWIVSAKGGDARRLTSDDGMEYFPKFSPDGRWFAFTGDYSGSRQVFAHQRRQRRAAQLRSTTTLARCLRAAASTIASSTGLPTVSVRSPAPRAE